MALFVAALIAVVGLWDHWTGPHISFSIFYLVPIAGAAWWLGVLPGYFAALVAAAVWLLVESHAVHGIAPWVLKWNAAVRLSFFMMFVALVAAVRRSKLDLEAEVMRQTVRVREIAEATSRDQARLARDLHDGIGQYLSGLALRTRMLADDLAADGSPRAADANRLFDVVQTVARESRRLDHFLGGVRSQDEDLPTALARLTDKINELFHLHCELALPEQPLRLQPLQADMLFHIAQEALNNAVKHAAGRGLRLSLTATEMNVSLRISDRGPWRAHPALPTTGAGLRMMRQRAELIGATLSLRRGDDGHGFVVECELARAPSSRSR